MIPSEAVTPSSPARPRSASSCHRRRWWWLVLLLVGLIVAYVVLRPAPRSAPPGAGKGGAQPAPVVAAAARRGDVDVYLSGLGNVNALNTVTVRSRVDGQLMEVRFREGQNVRKGELLALIDPRPFQAQLTQVEGQMARDREQLRNARLDLQRYQQLWQQDSIPRQQLDTQEALVRQLEGVVKVDQGLMENVRLQLTYCRITAPISGRVGLRQVDAGNIVHASDANGLVVITQIQPITVVFPLPEDNLPRLQAKMKGNPKLPVDAFDREQKHKLASGHLQTLDNQIDPATGTVKLKAVFSNSANELFPNQFVNARLLVDTLVDVVVIPAAALQRGSQGTFVYLVRPDSTVTIRQVTTGPAQGDDLAILKGLEVGDKLVVEGAERLREGSKVELRQPTKGSGAGRPAARPAP